MKQVLKYLCPVCAYFLEYPPRDFNICPSCGVEFGYSDAGRTYEELRNEWLGSGAQWSSKTEPPPPGWNWLVQLYRSGLLQLRVGGTDSEIQAENSSPRPINEFRFLEINSSISVI